MADEESVNCRPHTPTDGASAAAAPDGTALDHHHDDDKDNAPVGRSNSSSSSSGGKVSNRSRAAGVVAPAGHEGGFVQPASYLRPRGLSHPMTPVQPERAIDRDERLGLVSCVM